MLPQGSVSPMKSTSQTKPHQMSHHHYLRRQVLRQIPSNPQDAASQVNFGAL